MIALNRKKREDISYSYNFILILILFSIFLFVFSLSIPASSLLINEVMINPVESDTTHEWIELYNNGNSSINLSGWKLVDNYATDEIMPANSTTPVLVPPHTFVLITDQDTSISLPSNNTSSVIHFMVDDNSICNGLGNSDDYLLLLNENDAIIDCVEWGTDSENVAGQPIPAPAEGNSIIRLQPVQSNNSLIDFTETTTPTPGLGNLYSQTGSIILDTIQTYLPKVTKFDSYSTPFAIHVKITDLTPSTSYQLKSYIAGNDSSTYPASQTWTNEKWQYSDRYTHTILTNESGGWEGFLYLRFSKQYDAYKNHIQHNTSCTIHIKVKDNDTTTETQQHALLLDFDDSTTNGVPGGFVIGSTIENQLLYLTNQTGTLLSCYPSEQNEIDDFTPIIDGYYKLTGPVGSNFTLNHEEESGEVSSIQSNISIPYGIYHFDVETAESSFDRTNRKEFSTTLIINNTGTLTDTYSLSISDQSSGFHAHVSTKKITLNPGENQLVTVYIDPLSHRLYELHYGSIEVKISSLLDPILQKFHQFSCTLHEPDLTIPTIKTYDNTGTETSTVYEGNIIRVKAFFKNAGDEKARDASISYYLDKVTPESFLGMMTYETIEQYQKYPSLYWDTHLVTPGDHTIIVVADPDDNVKELDEYNNINSISLSILNTTPSPTEQQLLITEVYYHAYPTLNNEFITIHNPTNTSVNLGNWYITNTISRRITDQKKILFPKDSILPAHSSITLTQNSSSYIEQRLLIPDYEYQTDANASIPQLNTTHTMFFSNNGGAISLKDRYNHTIDSFIYGNISINCSTWYNPPIPLVEQGEIVKRQFTNDSYIDTNTASDWIHPNHYIIGQSSFSPEPFEVNATIIPFISPDTSFSVISTILNQADEQILLNVYEFTSTKLAQILIEALQRNVTVNILAEGSPIGGISEKQQYLFNRLNHHGANIKLLKGSELDHIYKRYRFTHAKYAIIDHATAIIHSGNYAPTGIPSESSFGNREWGVAITDESIARFYESVFNADWNPQKKDTLIYSPNQLIEETDYFLPDETYYGWYQPILNASPLIQKHITIQPIISPDNSLSEIINLLSSAQESIYIQQLYIYPNWTAQQNPLVTLLIDKVKKGIDVRIILNYNPWYDSTNIQNDQTKNLLESNGINVKYIYTNWSIFSNVHNKGAIIDNTSVLISSINWNENSFLNNREIGVVITDPSIATFYSDVFLSDWHLTEPILSSNSTSQNTSQQFLELNTNTIYITALFTMTFIVVARDWRKRSWP